MVVPSDDQSEEDAPVNNKSVTSGKLNGQSSKINRSNPQHMYYRKPTVSLFIFFLCVPLLLGSMYKSGGPEVTSEDSTGKIKVQQRFIAIDNVCAWPNLTVLEDGTIIATIFNQPSHARKEGDVECWASTDGKTWQKRGIPAKHEPSANRMNVAAGLAQNGDLLVLASGWSLKISDSTTSLGQVLPPLVSRSSDGGTHWLAEQQAFPVAEADMTEFIPFGDILPGEDGSLRAMAYAVSEGRTRNIVAMFRSDDDGLHWQHMATLSDGQGDTAYSQGHNETAMLHLGRGQWIAAARRWKAGQALDLFRSEDDGKTWFLDQPLTEEMRHPAHLLQLKNRELLLTYGKRVAGEYGIAVKKSTDAGKTWTDERVLLGNFPDQDMGYPSSVQLADGNILTAYYASDVESHQRYHMGVVLWEWMADE
jgi:hypothetical protein